VSERSADAGSRRAAFRCPICRRPVASDAKEAPFCSDRCRLVDLGRWLGGSYRITRPPDQDDDADV